MSRKYNVTLIIFAVIISLWYLPNLWKALLYWWFEITHPSLWFSPRYWILGSIYSAAAAGTALLPLYIMAWGSTWVEKATGGALLSLARITAVVVGMVALTLLLASAAGYIAPNYLPEFQIWLQG